MNANRIISYSGETGTRIVGGCCKQTFTRLSLKRAQQKIISFEEVVLMMGEEVPVSEGERSQICLDKGWFWEAGCGCGWTQEARSLIWEETG